MSFPLSFCIKEIAMATYIYNVVEIIDRAGQYVYDNTTATTTDLETYLNAQGALGWQVVLDLSEASPPRIVLMLSSDDP